MKYQEYDLEPLTDPLFSSVRERYEAYYREKFPNERQGIYREADWRRVQYATRLIPDGAASILEVGVGGGQMLNYLALSERYSEVVGIDIRRHSRYLQLTPAADVREMNVRKLDFPDRHFDVVFCMEVLEHVVPAIMESGLKELRRVTRGRLVMSVPFDEPLPLPSYHKQRFDAASIARIFPDAEVTLLHRPMRKGWPWALLVEAREPVRASDERGRA